eukprot:2754070-Amphidinium_carterae.1
MKSTAWHELFDADLPVVTESYDLHAAFAKYWHLHNKDPPNMQSLAQVILTWESSLEEIKQFFNGEHRHKVLYRE